jgi:hypothetical protein
MAFGTVNRVTVPRRQVGLTTSGRVWLTVWKRSGVTDTFERVDVASGNVLETAPAYYFNNGKSGRTPATPASVPLVERFGQSDSCPVMSVPPTMPVAATIGNESLCCCECSCGGGSDKPLPSAVGALLPSVLDEWERQCDGGGVVPTASDPTDSESWL